MWANAKTSILLAPTIWWGNHRTGPVGGNHDGTGYGDQHQGFARHAGAHGVRRVATDITACRDGWKRRVAFALRVYLSGLFCRMDRNTLSGGLSGKRSDSSFVKYGESNLSISTVK